MSFSMDSRLIFGLLSNLTMFDYAYAWMKSFKDNNDVAYLMLDGDSLIYVISIMMYEAYLYFDGHILPCIHVMLYESYELLCTRVDTALVILSSGKTLFFLHGMEVFDKN